LEKLEMKKSLIALAVLAASGAVMAQSSVTLYGRLDTYFANTTVDNGTTTTSTPSMKVGAVNGNRWGLKGAEDLGGGLKLIFTLEQGFNADDGSAASARAFHRQAWVGMSGGFGAVKFGRVYTAYDDVNGSADPVFDSALSPMGYVYKSNGYTSRIDNATRYETPTMGGFSGAVTMNMSEGSATALVAKAFQVGYAAGPLAVSLGYQTEGTGATTDDKQFTRLNASYDLGVVVLKGNYGKAGNMGNVSGADATDYELGFDYPVSSALTLSAAYAHSSDNATAGDATRKGYGLGAKYSLSKRTFVYGGYTSGNTSAPLVADTKTSMLAVGVNHAF